MRMKSFLSSFLLLLLSIPFGVQAQAATKYTLNITLEVKQKYPGVASPGEVINGCKEGFPMDYDFTQDARWEVLGSKKDLIGTAGVLKVGVKGISQVPAPYHDVNEEELLPYIYNGTCIYTAKVVVPKSAAYRFIFGGRDLNTSYSFTELTSKKWKVLIKKDLNCGGLYVKKCS